MTITRALAEIKLIEAKLQNFKPIVDVKIGSKLSINPHLTEDELISVTKSHVQSIIDLYDRRCKIKKAIAEANTKETVTIKHKTMTLIEAIDYKSSSSLLKNQYENWKKQFNTCSNIIEKNDMKIEQEVSAKVESSYGSNQQTSKSIVSDLTEQYKQIFGSKLISSFSVKEVDKLIEDLDEIISEIDMCLSEKNASCNIEI